MLAGEYKGLADDCVDNGDIDGAGMFYGRALAAYDAAQLQLYLHLKEDEIDARISARFGGDFIAGL